jgi:hypothetical protein
VVVRLRQPDLGAARPATTSPICWSSGRRGREGGREEETQRTGFHNFIEKVDRGREREKVEKRERRKKEKRVCLWGCTT